MDTKLTLKLDKDVIEKAKRYAVTHDISLSQMVEKYFIAVTGEGNDNNVTLSPVVRELSGVIDADSSSVYRDDYADYLANKYK